MRHYDCDLHTHTVRSDGNDSYAELIEAAAQKGIKVLAITDHDMTPLYYIETGQGTVSTVEYARSLGVALILGIELSCETNIDDVHILGYGCDFNDPAFEAERRVSDESKINGYKELLERLTARGMPLSWQEVLNDAEVPRKENEVQRKHIFELLAKKGYAPSWKDAKLMVIADPQLNVRRRKPDPDQAIKLIHDTGGIAVLAHPYLIGDTLKGGVDGGRDEYIDRLIACGLDGIEAAYPYEKTSYKGRESALEIEHAVRKKYQTVLPIISGGSDYHNEAKKGIDSPRLLGEKGVSLEYFRNNPLLRGLLAGGTN